MGIRNFIAMLALTLLCACPTQQAADSPQAEAPAPRQPSAPRMLTVVCDPLLEGLLTELEPSLRDGLKGYELEPVDPASLLERIEAGDSFEGVDAFAIADPQVNAALRESGLVSEATMRTFAGERLALISRKDESWRAPDLFDIYRLRFKRLDIGGPELASSYFAEQALISDGAMPRVEDRVKREGGVASILTGLDDNVAQLAILPRSSVFGREEYKIVLLIGRDLHEDFVYQLAGAAGSETDDSVMALLTGLAENPEIQTLIEGYGFDNRAEAMGMNSVPE